MGKKVVVLIGPTAVGKTKMSIQLAKRLNGEIINGDSMQVYKGLDIGTAKIRQEETEGIPHHLLDIKEPHESFSVAEFQTLARSLIKDITKRGKLPIIVGGTGLYIQSVIYDYQFSDAPSNDLYRQSLERCSPGELYEQLKRIDPLSAERIHPNNVRRVIRALEIYHCTGKTMTEWLKEQKRQLVYNVALIGLTMEREKLYARINQRVDQMIDQGLIEEVKRLYEQGLRDCQAIQAIGYKELYAYFDGMLTLKEAIEQLKQNSRRYAKRQFTWFRNQMPVQWFDMTDDTIFERRVNEILHYIEGKFHFQSNM
ncbi:tRNA (adenosine(37)-N6)-dimethylallyltransferase MiaA [Anoxybacillus flavithermus]|uniref:tRNA (adenosine(37)-N6)-dimethylallyltransferase MiaA n=1 Tax=Anoxybacillus flavithermus TaxID=33934 RepID=UPI001865EE37|nr:tRNA (adenosine(37)-N6)-dimethylallyltransferase MiaA [Anoxybacillus flavithermus]MBE2910436.1 tRNA (adenosine(37)-N6)-dimethylallyltransferase MiaA [Anoxybacillus flavithermus]